MNDMKFWYKDNWIGSIKEFETIDAARESAQKEDGISITIFTNKNGKTEIAETVKANGYTYP